MSTAIIKSPQPDPPHSVFLERTVHACHLAKEAASAAAEGIATSSKPLLNSVRPREKELDDLDLEIDAGVTRDHPGKPSRSARTVGLYEIHDWAGTNWRLAAQFCKQCVSCRAAHRATGHARPDPDGYRP